MIDRRRRLLGSVAIAALILLALTHGAWCQGGNPPSGSPPTTQKGNPPAAPGPTTPAAGAVTTRQTGLPPELTIGLKRIDEEQKALDSALAYIRSNRPSGNFLSKAWRAVSGFFAGGSKPTPTTLEAIAASGASWNGKLVGVEGMVEEREGQLALVAGQLRVPLTKLAATLIQGFPGEELNGLPARVEGIVIIGQAGPEINVNRLEPGPSLTPTRLARCHELRDTASDYQQAVDLYAEGAAVEAVQPWSGFAMANGGRIAADVLRNRKSATSLYKQAWDLEGRVKSTHPKRLPVTWLQDPQTGVWDTKTLREAVGEPLDKLNAQGFWYKFVDAFVTVSGGNAGIGLILLAVGTRLLLYPLTKKQISSARDMQRLQPQIKALQEKHGADKEKFNQEFWRLCKDNGVNPLGGCLPLIIQMPLLILVYQGIQAYVVELANHHFLWIPSLADPNTPLLVLYTISMIAFQKLTMKTQPMSDPQQQQQQNMMVWMMPLMFFMFFQGLPSGFILYWLGTNLIYLPQQYFGTRVKPTDASSEKTWTLDTRPATEASKPEGPFAGLRRLFGGSAPKAEEPSAPASYEEKKTAEKRKQRRRTRRGRRP